ncbi:MAG: HAD family phosphatase [Clostridia bacterium]|nr:HAD family phosphatase [Clostridia bacterium]
MIKNIVFDIGKVMVTFDWDQAINQVTKSKEAFDKIAETTVQGMYWDELDRGVMTTEEIVHTWEIMAPGLEKEINKFFELVPEYINPYPYAEKWVNSYKDRGFNVYFLSNFSDLSWHKLHDKFTFLKREDGEVISYTVKCIKPDLKIYNLLLDKYNLKAEECIFIDDREVNCNAAKKVGMNAVVFENYDDAVTKVERIIESNK